MENMHSSYLLYQYMHLNFCYIKRYWNNKTIMIIPTLWVSPSL